MSEKSWSDWFSSVGNATVKGLEIVADLVSRVEVAFDANRQRGVGILWLPKSKQVLYYSIEWRHCDLDFREKTECEIQLVNTVLGFAMWTGLILCHRTVMVRPPAIKVSHIEFIAAEEHRNAQGDRSVLWSIVENAREGMVGEWSYIPPHTMREDVKFQQVRRLCQGQLLTPDSEAFRAYSLVRSDPRPVIQCILSVIPNSYRNARE